MLILPPSMPLSRLLPNAEVLIMQNLVSSSLEIVPGAVKTGMTAAGF